MGRPGNSRIPFKIIKIRPLLKLSVALPKLESPSPSALETMPTLLLIALAASAILVGAAPISEPALAGATAPTTAAEAQLTRSDPLRELIASATELGPAAIAQAKLMCLPPTGKRAAREPLYRDRSRGCCVLGVCCGGGALCRSRGSSDSSALRRSCGGSALGGSGLSVLGSECTVALEIRQRSLALTCHLIPRGCRARAPKPATRACLH
jgi:hypothetical protein